MAHLITADSIKNAGFAISAYFDNAKIETCINEAEQIHVKQRITDALFLDLLKWTEAADKSGFPAGYETLMNGGEWQSGSCNEKVTRQFEGLTAAVNYYTYARMIRHADENTTRFGFMQKTDEYSTHSDFRAKQAACEDALHTADIFMNDIISFLNDNRTAFPLFVRAGKAKNRLAIQIIK
jgi:hypothetical protein